MIDAAEGGGFDAVGSSIELEGVNVKYNVLSAAMHGHLPTVEYLLGNGADVKMKAAVSDVVIDPITHT